MVLFILPLSILKLQTSSFDDTKRRNFVSLWEQLKHECAHSLFFLIIFKFVSNQFYYNIIQYIIGLQTNLQYCCSLTVFFLPHTVPNHQRTVQPQRRNCFCLVSQIIILFVNEYIFLIICLKYSIPQRPFILMY